MANKWGKKGKCEVCGRKEPLFSLGPDGYLDADEAAEDLEWRCVRCLGDWEGGESCDGCGDAFYEDELTARDGEKLCADCLEE